MTAEAKTASRDVDVEKVEWRVDSAPFDRDQGGTVCRWVPYLNAAIVTGILDEWVGPDGWSDRYEVGTIAGKEVLWCHLTVGDVTKSDVGIAPSGTDGQGMPQKGAVSDAFKRAACLKWGAGRNVYALPTLWAPCATYGQGERRKAKENAQTRPELLRQLEARGFTVEKVDVRDDVDPETGEITGPGGADDRETSGNSTSGEAISPPGPVDDLDTLAIRDLTERLRAADLPVGGTKADMIARLRDAA